MSKKIKAIKADIEDLLRQVDDWITEEDRSSLVRGYDNGYRNALTRVLGFIKTQEDES